MARQQSGKVPAGHEETFMNFLKNIRIGTKVMVGFAIVLALLATVAGVGYFGLQGAGGNFSDYREAALQRNQFNRIANAMQRVRVNVRNFLLDSTDAVAKQTFDRLDLTQKEIDDAQQLMAGRKDLLPQVDKMDGWIKEWRREFQTMVDLQGEIDRQVRDGLQKAGPDMERDLTALMESMKKDGSTDGILLAAEGMRQLLLARLYGQRFLRASEESAAERVKKEMAEFSEHLGELAPIVKTAEEKALLAKVGTAAKAYLAAWDATYKATLVRDHTFKVKITQLGNDLVKTGDDVMAVLRDYQDALGPRAQARTGRPWSSPWSFRRLPSCSALPLPG